MHAGTYQVECLTIWFNFMFFHIFDKAAVGIPRKGKKVTFLTCKSPILQSLLSSHKTLRTV